MTDAADDAIDKEELMVWVRNVHNSGHLVPLPIEFEGCCPFCETENEPANQPRPR